MGRPQRILGKTEAFAVRSIEGGAAGGQGGWTCRRGPVQHILAGRARRPSPQLLQEERQRPERPAGDHVRAEEAGESVDVGALIREGG